MKILLLTKYSRMGASSRLRFLQYLPALKTNGLNVTVSNLFDDDYLNRLYLNGHRSVFSIAKCYWRRFVIVLSVFKYDLIWIEKEIFPYFPALVERLLRIFGIAYVVDYDDAIFHNYDLSDNVFIRTFMRRKIDVVMRNATCVLAGNEYLASRARAAGAPYVELIPTVVDLARYSPRAHLVSARPVIGWIGSPATQRYLVGISDALKKACQRHNARLMLVGATEQMVAEFSGLDIDIVPWSEASEVELIRQMDIGIMPLPDGPWEKGKCAYKLIQYMACSVPVIASPVGVNIDVVNGSLCGLLADDSAQWEAALLQLLESPIQRAVLGDAGRKAVEKIYSLQAQAPVLRQIFNTSIQPSGV